MFYFASTPQTVPEAAPAQLAELTFRDPYLMNFITDPEQTTALMNYDVSYVNNLVGPVAMEASTVPITYGTVDSTTTPPTYYGYKDFGWLATDRDTKTFQGLLRDFVKNTGKAKIGDYFGGKDGWPQYYNPNPDEVVIPSAPTYFLNSPLTTETSPYDGNFWLLTSNGDEPIGTVLGALPNGSTTVDISPSELPSKLAILQKGMVVTCATPGIIQPGTTVTKVRVTGANQDKPYVVLSKPTGTGAASGEVLTFARPVNDYAVSDITRLWYSWANYYVGLFGNFPTETAMATLNAYVTSKKVTTNEPLNEITLTSAPTLANPSAGGTTMPLRPGMTVSGSGIPAGTTILSITDPSGNPLGSADKIGDNIYLSQIPANVPPGQAYTYTFSKPQPIPYANSTTPSPAPVLLPPLKFTADLEKAELFAGSVYEAMSAEAPAVQPSALPFSAQLVNQVIKYYAKLPGYTTKDPGPILVGNIRDVVKSILRGVWNFYAVPVQSQWYPDPATKTGGQDFNVYNLDPYVWFVHKVEDMSAYGFSVDDDVSNPQAVGPVLAPYPPASGLTVQNHLPDNLQIAFGGIKGFGNQDKWFPTIPWGSIRTTATITTLPAKSKNYPGYDVVNLTGRNALKVYNQINNPGTGQVGAYISAPGYIQPGTTLIFKGPTSGLDPQIVLSQPALHKTHLSIPVTITAGSLPLTPIRPAAMRAP